MWIVSDITARKQAEAEQSRLETQIQHVQRLESLGVLAGGLAHDFNNLLMGILGNAELALLSLPQDSSTRARVADIRKAGLRAAELTQQMLAFAGRGRLAIEPIHLNALITELAFLLLVSIAKRASLKYELSDRLPLFDGDPSQVRQVVLNLLTNAAEAVQEKGGVILIRTGVRRVDQTYLSRAILREPRAEGEYVFLEVADNGCGMDSATLGRIFDPFFTTKFTGRGLGLAAVMGMVRAHQGAILVESVPGKGSTFTVLFPVSPRQEPPRRAEGPSAQAWRGSGVVLLSGEDQASRPILRLMLEQAGLEVVEAEGATAAAAALRARPEVGLVCLSLAPAADGGWEAAKELRAARPELPLLVVSELAEADAAARFGTAEKTVFLQRPFETPALLAILRRLLERRPPGTGAG
jgi:nitrogen-specific signal transduction histidine kinase/CheY-like chemotaxis protein